MISFLSDLVDLIDVNDSVLGQFYVAISLLDQIADQVVDIAANISRFREFGGVGLNERNANQFGDIAHQIGLPDSGGPQENDILLGVVPFPQVRILQAFAHMVEVVANGHGDDFFCFPLLYDESVQVIADLPRF